MRPRIALSMDYDSPEASRERHRAFLNLAYIDAVDRAGGRPMPIPPLEGGALAEIMGSADGVVLTGGSDVDPCLYGCELHPKTEVLPTRKGSSDMEIARLALDADIPILGICMGIQLLNVVAGGTLVQDVPSARPGGLTHPSTGGVGALHKVRVVAGTMLERIVGAGEIEVNSRHHQAIDRLGEGLVTSAEAPDGLIEAVEMPGRRFVLAVQWHPEDMTDRPEHLALFTALVAAAR